jgi:hypothetical protein
MNEIDHFKSILNKGWEYNGEYKGYKVFSRKDIANGKPFNGFAFWNPENNFWKNYVTFFKFDEIWKELYSMTETEYKLAKNWDDNIG